jgi:hypothetical protein
LKLEIGTLELIVMILCKGFLLNNFNLFRGSAQFPLANLTQGQELDLWLGVGKGQLHVAVTALDFGKQPQQQFPQFQQYVPQQYYPMQQPLYQPMMQPNMMQPNMMQPNMMQQPYQQPMMQQPTVISYQAQPVSQTSIPIHSPILGSE